MDERGDLETFNDCSVKKNGEIRLMLSNPSSVCHRDHCFVIQGFYFSYFSENCQIRLLDIARLVMYCNRNEFQLIIFERRLIAVNCILTYSNCS